MNCVNSLFPCQLIVFEICSIFNFSLQSTIHSAAANANLLRGATASMAQMSQHKRSLSFNHHLSYNQYSSSSNNNCAHTSSNIVNATLNHNKQMIDPSLQHPPHVQLRERPDPPAPSVKTSSKGMTTDNKLRIHLHT